MRQLRAALRGGFFFLLAIAALVWVIGLGGCASAIPPDPTPERPRIACIADSPLPARQISKGSGNRLLPEIVRVIGVTTAEDGERWKVLRAGEFDPEKWQPWPKRKIQFHGCGPEAEAVKEVVAEAW